MLVTDKNITDDIIDMADKAMLQAKHTGRDRYAVYEPKSV
jgi:PleD family two-component response regulator